MSLISFIVADSMTLDKSLGKQMHFLINDDS